MIKKIMTGYVGLGSTGRRCGPAAWHGLPKGGSAVWGGAGYRGQDGEKAFVRRGFSPETELFLRTHRNNYPNPYFWTLFTLNKYLP
jgi:hypothetical protein